MSCRSETHGLHVTHSTHRITRSTPLPPSLPGLALTSFLMSTLHPALISKSMHARLWPMRHAHIKGESPPFTNTYIYTHTASIKSSILEAVRCGQGGARDTHRGASIRVGTCHQEHRHYVGTTGATCPHESRLSSLRKNSSNGN